MSTIEQVRAARICQVWSARLTRERAEATLHEVVRKAAAGGVPERDLAKASGISRTKVRRILGRD